MLYYDVDEDDSINSRKQAFVERIGDECVAEDMPFFLELMSYDANIDDNKSREYAKVKAHKVNDMIKEFAKPRYNVDVLKVEVPIIMDFVEGYGDGEPVFTREEAKKLFKEQDEATNRVDRLPRLQSRRLYLINVLKLRFYLTFFFSFQIQYFNRDSILHPKVSAHEDARKRSQQACKRRRHR